MRGDPSTRNPNKYCHFHKEYRHNTKNCWNLKIEIEDLIKQGYLKRFIKDEQTQGTEANKEASQNSRQQELPARTPQAREKQVRGTINVIMGGSIIAGCTSSSRRNAVRELEQEDGEPHKCLKTEELIYFTNDDTRGIQYPHDDTLVVKLLINDFKVKRILVDSGSSTNILFTKAFKRMEFSKADLQLANIPLVGFNGEVVRLIGKIRLPIEDGSPPHTVRLEHDFLVVVASSPYNAILGRQILHALRVVVSTYHLALKFPTNTGVGVLHADQLESRKCYMASLKAKGKMIVDIDLDPPPENIEERARPIEDTVAIQVSKTDPEKVLRIGVHLKAPQ
ncbi:PREDICTED: uncharacterized protein LOC104611892 [Nelumbo nucifera]|uniref:Uncharacterized protein LOC104611892 n=1 Tax=Nelumbo nucifera TaxID=4432 RepID=A0A1U8BKS9_NELNU|nr:PREDICTED: uncharacterized protein LOC104611892 [Nelumbo nucifera]